MYRNLPCNFELHLNSAACKVQNQTICFHNYRPSLLILRYAFFSITFVLRAIFFFRQALAGNFVFKITHPPTPPQELNGRRPVTLILFILNCGNYWQIQLLASYLKLCDKIQTLLLYLRLYLASNPHPSFYIFHEKLKPNRLITIRE